MRRQVVIPAILLLAFSQATFGQIQLIQNGGFESPSYAPWVLEGTGVTIGSGAGAYDGNQYLSMGNALGAVQSAYQVVTFPTNLIAATLSLYLDIISSDTAGNDTLTVYITDTNQPPDVLTNLGSASNGDTTGGYVGITDYLATYPGGNILSSYAGQTVEVYFYVTTDPNYGILTSFNFDDVSLLAGTTADIPSNDNFSNATAILGTGITNDVNTTYASKEPGEPDHAGNAGGHSVWWTWTSPAIGTVTINTSGSSFETLLAVYTGSSLTNLTVVTNNNGNTRASGWASVKFNVPAGATYQIALDGYNGQAGNAVLSFSFALDTTPPSVAISSPAAGAVVTSASVVVTGTARDNVAVAVVEYRLENASGTNVWQVAASTNAWSTWSATVTHLIPGPNTVTVEAFDTSSNMSALVSRVFDYEVRAPLSLSTNGRGTISGATNGQLLNLGFLYKITAKPAAGFAFTGWTGSIATNTATLSFVMATNLGFTANFVDVEKPTLSITAPTAGQRWSNSTFQITGKAADNVAVSNVWYQLDEGAWNNPATTNLWSHWSATVTLTQSNNNTVKAYAVDEAGNRSATNSVNFVYIPSARLQLAASGRGMISPNYSNALLQLGETLTLTATAGAGYVFSNWTDISGAVVTNGPALKFVMQSNLLFTANFIPNPFLLAAGTYEGLFFDANGVVPAGSGFFSAQVNNNGNFTAKLQQGNASHPISGQFSLTGEWSTNTLAAWAGTAVSLTLDLTGGAALNGGLTNAGWTAQLEAGLAVFSKTNPAPQAGNYTVVLPGTSSAALPGGNGFGAVTVNASGAVTFSGVLGDGTKVTQSATVSPQGRWPLYIPLASGNGLLLGWLTFTNGPDSDLDGPLQWFKPSLPATPLYPAGFTNEIEAVGSAYSLSNGGRVLNLTNGFVLLEHGGLSETISNQFVLGANNEVTGSEKLILTFTTATGLFQGSATNPPGKAISFSGAVLQKQNAGFGQFLGASQSGSVYLAPR
jgi:hypothetical protein